MTDLLIRAVDRALAILECFRPGDQSLTLSQIAARTSLSKATAIRLLATLERRAMVARTASGSYALGPALLRLGTLFMDSLDVAAIVNPSLARMVDATGESAAFFVREGAFRRCLLRADSPRTLRDHVRVGDLLPLPLGAFGRVIEAFDDAHAPPYAGDLPIVTRGERVAQLASIAMPVWGPGDRFRGAVGLAVPLFRLTDDLLATGTRLVRQEAEGLTRQMGGAAPLGVLAVPGEVQRLQG